MLAYELCDTLALYAEDSMERQAEALNVMQITSSFCLQSLGMKEAAAIEIFTRTFREVRRTRRKVGGNAKLSDVVTEMSLDQRK